TENGFGTLANGLLGERKTLVCIISQRVYKIDCYPRFQIGLRFACLLLEAEQKSILRRQPIFPIHPTERQQHSEFHRLRVQVRSTHKAIHERDEENTSEKSSMRARCCHPTHGSPPSDHAS